MLSIAIGGKIGKVSLWGLIGIARKAPRSPHRALSWLPLHNIPPVLFSPLPEPGRGL